MQRSALCGFCEIFVNEPNLCGPRKAGASRAPLARALESAERSRSPNSEPANGRLAMVAIMGMMFQTAPSAPLEQRCGSRAATSGMRWEQAQWASGAP